MAKLCAPAVTATPLRFRTALLIDLGRRRNAVVELFISTGDPAYLQRMRELDWNLDLLERHRQYLMQPPKNPCPERPPEDYPAQPRRWPIRPRET